MNVQALLSICVLLVYEIHATCLMSAGSDCALKVTMCRAAECVCLRVVVVVGYRACRFFLLLLFCFYFQCTYKCMNGWMECEWEVKQVLFFGVVVWFGWLEWKKREMKNDMGVSSRARMCLCSMVSKKKRNFWLTIHFALTFLWLGFFSLFLSSYRKRLS